MARTKDTDAPAVVTVRRLDGAVVEVPRAAALLEVMLERARPEGWTPAEAEQRALVQVVFEAVEMERGAAPDAVFLRAPRVRRIYERLDSLTTEREPHFVGGDAA